MATKKIPYGISDFQRFSSDDYYYVDKTRFIEEIEKAPSFLFLIRPRRFGKSLWLNMLKLYYDIAARELFEELFGQYYIGKHPTPERNSYLILSFNFAQVNPAPEMLQQSFEEHTALCFKDFNEKYSHLLGKDYLEGYAQTVNAENRLEYIALCCKQRNLPVYLIIDEYDNFTNVVLSRYGHERYHDLTHGAGFFRFFFNKIKGATTDAGASFKRMFISGVSPVTLDDVTSGFNIASMITLDPHFNEILGFTEREVREMLEYYKAEGCWSGDTEEILGIMRKWYNNYCFSPDCSDVKMYNPDMVLYFMNYLTSHGEVPDTLVDYNVKTDYKKLQHLVILDKHLNGNFSRIRQIAEEGELITEIETAFPAEDLVESKNFVSLLFYFGILTIDRVEYGSPVLRVPNLTIRQVLFSYIEQGYRRAEVFRLDESRLRDFMRRMAYFGEWQPVFQYLADKIKEQTAVRDYLQGEKVVQTFHLVYLSLTNFFVIYPEQEMNKGYGDLWMSPNFLNHPEMKYCYVVEFKYLKHEATDEEVAAKLEEAREQLRQYAGDAKCEAAKGQTALRKIAVVYRAWELTAMEEVE